MAAVSRRTFLSSAAVGAGAFALPRFARAQGANEAIRVGVIGCGGRGNEHIEQMTKIAGVELVAFCDADAQRAAKAAAEFPGSKTYADMRKLLDDPSIDAVTIATCNHWHCLAAVWAVEAGKHVYCEKPLSHSLWEGRQLVAAAKAHDRIVCVGTQQRSDPLQAEVKDFLHDQRALGAIKSVVIARFGVRTSIGKRDTPLEAPASVDRNLWTGPAQDLPIYRNAWHYDWHWSWNTGDGECGNWGVHLIDDVINVVFRDKHKLPDRVCSGGARVVWNDAGESPNFHVAYLEAGDTPVLFALSNLPAAPDQDRPVKFDDVDCGYVVLCEGGAYRGRRGGGEAVAPDGQSIRKFRGDSGGGHMQNFFAAVRAHDRKLLNAPVEVGHSSAGWSHVINAAYRAANVDGLVPPERIAKVPGHDRLHNVIEEHLQAHGLKNSPAFHTSALLEIDADSEQLSGDGADIANAALGKPIYRGEFAIPG